MHGLVPTILKTRERVANIFLNMDANFCIHVKFTYVSKSAHVNGALDSNLLHSCHFCEDLVPKHFITTLSEDGVPNVETISAHIISSEDIYVPSPI